VRGWLEASADDLGPEGFDNQFGHGRLNVAAAVILAANGDGPPPDEPASQLSVSLEIMNPDTRLGNGDRTTARATVTRNGTAESGMTVNFAVDSDLATVVPTTAPTDAQGVAQVQVQGATSWRSTTVTVSATANGASDAKPVKVPDLPVWAIVLVVAVFAFVELHRRVTGRDAQPR
jgi:hypothetical protein